MQASKVMSENLTLRSWCGIIAASSRIMEASSLKGILVLCFVTFHNKVSHSWTTHAFEKFLHVTQNGLLFVACYGSICQSWVLWTWAPTWNESDFTASLVLRTKSWLSQGTLLPWPCWLAYHYFPWKFSTWDFVFCSFKKQIRLIFRRLLSFSVRQNFTRNFYS